MSGTPEEVFRDEKKLRDIKLDVPFSLKLEAALKKQGVTTNREITMEGLVDELCRLHSNM
jgi:energy-coupling factor transport system ATP-binding protein